MISAKSTARMATDPPVSNRSPGNRGNGASAWPQVRPLFFHVSAVDGKGGLWGLDDTVALAHQLRARDIDLVDCSSGGISGESDVPPVPRVPGYQAPYVSRVRRIAGDFLLNLRPSCDLISPGQDTSS
jgi:hypothetical protein